MSIAMDAGSEGIQIDQYERCIYNPNSNEVGTLC